MSTLFVEIRDLQNVMITKEYSLEITEDFAD